ncbi:hypothetical protein ACFPOA_15750 [Lysobacter niabensis]|uniref:hypothetical protein n=1 Tax=Agrilutibacter niabensis TaxID=380628 RepID=UPI00361AF06B
MANFWRFVAVIVGPGALLLLALVGHTAFDTYLLGNCDPKFGCGGGVQVIAFVSGLALLCSSLGHLPVCLLFLRMLRQTRALWLLVAIAALGLGQGVLFAASGDLLPGDSLQSMMAAWAGASALMALVVLGAVRYWAPNNSFKPKPLRGSA